MSRRKDFELIAETYRISNNQDEGEDKWVYFVKFLNKKGMRENVLTKLKKYSELSEEELDLLKHMNPYQNYFNNLKRSKSLCTPLSYEVGRKKSYREVAFVGPKDEILNVLERYKKGYGERYKEELPLKPKSEEVFGDIMFKLNEATVKGENKNKWILFMKMNKNGIIFARMMPITEMSEDDKKLLNMMERFKSVSMFKCYELPNPGSEYILVMAWIGKEEDIKAEYNGRKKEMGDKFKEEIIFNKPETKRHFGDVIFGLNN